MSTEIKNIGVCGAGGTMGAGIAIVAARAGYETICYDTCSQKLDQARTQTERFLQKSVERDKVTDKEAEAILARMRAHKSMESLADCDLVIEAVFEDLQVKRNLLGALDGICKSPTIFASNTSTLSITEIAAGCNRQDRVVGMHFCLPAQLMKLIEMSPGVNTSKESFVSAWTWAEAAGQQPVNTQDKPGFILNALLVPFNNDAIRAVEANIATPADIDKAIKSALNYKMGPLELLDLVGLDTQMLLCEALYPITLDPRASPPPLLRRMVAAGKLGKKTGQGFYTYGGNAMFGG